jgi:hypothetical protein
VLKKVKGNPYSAGTLKLMVVFLLLAGVNYFLFKFDNPWIDGISRSVVLAVVGAALLYVLKVSDEVNSTVRAVWHRLRRDI